MSAINFKQSSALQSVANQMGVNLRRLSFELCKTEFESIDHKQFQQLRAALQEIEIKQIAERRKVEPTASLLSLSPYRFLWERKSVEARR